MLPPGGEHNTLVTGVFSKKRCHNVGIEPGTSCLVAGRLDKKTTITMMVMSKSCILDTQSRVMGMEALEVWR